MKYLIWPLFMIPITAGAFYKQIYNGYTKSKRVKILKLDESISYNSFMAGKEKYSWNFEVGAAQSDSFLRGLFSFQSQNTLSQTNSIGFSKASYNWGNISLKQVHTRYDLSNWDQGNLSSLEDDQLFEVRNVVSYQYEILNNSLEQDWRSVFAQKESEALQNNVSLHKDYMEFFQAYIQAKQLVILDRYYREFEKRASLRVKKLIRRVKDGLSRSVDKKQAELSLISQKERILENQTNLKERILFIEKIVGFEITPAYYQKLNWSFKQSQSYESLFQIKTNIELQRLEAALKLAEINLESLTNKNNHSLKLNLEYSKNAISPEDSESFELATFGNGRNEEKIIGINYSIPIGGERTKALSGQLNNLRKQNELKLSDFSSDIENKIKSLKDAIKSYEQAIELSNSKIRIADDIVKETQDLYYKGRSSFEEVLRSEEAALNARISRVNHLLLLENSYVNLAFVTGNTFDFLKRYED